MRHAKPCYRFAVLSDIHIDLEDGGKKAYFVHAEENFARALEVITNRGCDFVISAGDQVTNASGAAEEWKRYRDIIERSGYQGSIFEAMGNHETRFAHYGGCTIEECREEFLHFTVVQSKPVIRPQDKTYYTYIDKTFGDAFVFLSPENGVNTNEIDNFSDAQMDWAEEIIDRFTEEGRRIFLIQHAPLYGFGAGDDTASPAYEGSIRLQSPDGKPFENNRRFYRLICRCHNMIWLSGHTHVDLRDHVNYSSDNGNACHMLHIPALVGSTRLIRQTDGTSTLDRTFYHDAAQGYIADVEEDRVVFRGIDFLSDRFYPEYTYTIYRQNHRPA